MDLNLPGLGVTVLFGHSGSGKTTLLQCIAGLERVPQGHLWMKGEVWQDDRRFVPTHRRPLGYVFQEASLFPHRSARANLEYGWRRAARPLDQAALDDLIELLGIGALLDRRPHQLSGGERQRVAIVRALAVCPAVLLMDEPFSALDLRRKREILPYLERVHDALEIPVLYVTHSPDEVARLADHLVVLEAGRAVAQGPLKEVLGRVDAPIRLGTEAGGVLEGRVAERDARWHLARVEFRGGSLWVREEGHALGRALRLRVPAKDVSMTLERPSGTSILNQLAVTVREIGDDLHPAQALASLEVDGQTLTARLTHRSVAALALHPGKRVWAQVKTVAVIE